MKLQLNVRSSFAVALIALTWLILNSGCKKTDQDIELRKRETPDQASATNVSDLKNANLPVNHEPIPGTNVTQLLNSKSNLDAEVIQVVKNFYESHKTKIPEEILIRERNSNYWCVVADPGSPIEMVFHISPATKSILKAVGE